MMKDEDGLFHSNGLNYKSARIKILSLVILESDRYN